MDDPQPLAKFLFDFTNVFVIFGRLQDSWITTDHMLTINLWFYSVLMKLVPCLVLVVVTWLLVFIAQTFSFITVFSLLNIFDNF